MGMVHQIRVIAKIPLGPESTYRAIDAINIPGDDPGSDKLRIASQVLSFFKANRDLIQLELAWAKTLSDDEWSRKSLEAGEGTLADVDRLKHKTAQLKNEAEAGSVPQFPVVRMCLLLAILTHHDSFLHSLGFPQWNSAPGDGGQWMWETGCTIFNLTDLSVAFVVPSRRTCGLAKRSTYDLLKLRSLSGEQYLAAFGHEHEYCGPVRANGDAEAASIMPMKTIQEVWPLFPPIYKEIKYNEDGEEDEKIEEDEDNNNNNNNNAMSYSRCDEIFRDETQQYTGTEVRSDKSCALIEEQGRKLDKVQELLSNYKKKDVALHKFDYEFPTLVDRFVRAHSKQFTITMPGTVPLLRTALGHQHWKLCYVSQLDLSRFPELPGDTVVELVRAVVNGNQSFLAKTRKGKKGDKRELAPLKLLDISFNHGVMPDHVARILDITRLGELRFWDNPGLASAVSDGRIAKLTSRERFQEPLQKLVARQATQRRRRDTAHIQPAPPMAPTPARIRQLVWMTLKTVERNRPSAVVDWMQLPLSGKVSLAQLDADKLAWILDPRFYDKLEGMGEDSHIFAETVAFPLHDIWAPRDEVYTSAARFEKSMTTNLMLDSGHNTLSNGWPLKLPLLMATGCKNDTRAITSPFPEILVPAWEESVGNESYEKPMRQRGFGAIVPSESTLVFLHEQDLGLVHYGLVTCMPDDELEVRDPAAAAREAGDENAAQAWEQGFPAEKEGEEPQKRYMLLDADAVKKMWAASTNLAKRRNRYSLLRFLKDFQEEKAAAAEHQRLIAEQNTKTESGCKRHESEELNGCKEEPEAKRIKAEPKN
ncbi:hypothetical protein F4802DRAFT_170980 [Xylaria palmicola]|nr:hypothetical protein F4802DRAFT_170980 [Xylaria palmicola]